MQEALGIALWAVILLAYLALMRYVRSVQRRTRQQRKEAAMACLHAIDPGCGCPGCPGSSCWASYSASPAHCACTHCLLVCAGLHGYGAVHGGSYGSGSGSANTVHFPGGSMHFTGGTVSGSAGGGGGSAGSGQVSGAGYASGSTGYASGSFSGMTVPAPHATRAVPAPHATRARAGRAGIEGFDGRGSADFDLAPGRVLGLRQWSVPSPDLSGNPLDTGWNPQYITGATGKQWGPGVFEAVCSNDYAHRPPVDEDEQGVCGCGCWGYWSPAAMSESDWVKRGQLALTGIIEGTGRVLIGEKGFRCQRARIVALSLSSVIRPAVQGPREQVPEQELAEAQDRADAWMAVIDDRLGQLFPDVRMFATVKGMLAAFPPGEKFQ